MKKRFNQLIREALEYKDISLRELARKSKFDVSFLSKILSGKRNPPGGEKELARIARALDITPERLMLASGRVPASLEELLNDEKVIQKLIAGRKSLFAGEERKDIPKKSAKKSPSVINRPPEIEDELL
ncbi:MAG: helix-turn-helix transcriptional regulator [Elusimicrobia bacterium]|nr:helix-turn-helix transcriptional regulator [Elusimicrobiota bacterium]